MSPVRALDVVEDFSATARCDEGFLRLRRLRVQNVREDGSRSVVYRVDVVDRPALDAVAVLVFRRRAGGGVEYLTRTVIRPAAYFRRERVPVVPDGREHLFTEEIIAGVLEPGERGEGALLARAAAELHEEGGLHVPLERLERLGPPFMAAPGIVSEKIFLLRADVTGLPQGEPGGDGSPLEEGGTLRWRTEEELEGLLAWGDVQDAKLELALRRHQRRRG